MPFCALNCEAVRARVFRSHHGRDSAGGAPPNRREMAREGMSEKIAFVSDNPGTTFAEVSAVVAAFVVATWLRVSAESYFAESTSRSVRIALDWVFSVLPSLACVFATEFATSVAVVAGSACALKRVGATVSVGAPSVSKEMYLSAVTLYRFTLTMLTVVAILAIDFTPFPRRLGKTETYGVSLMDIGSGSYVFSSGLVSRFARGERRRSLTKSTRKVLPLIVLGLARLAITKAVGYHLIESEYGRHWNFFFTLAGVNLMADALPIREGMAIPLGCLVSFAYQCALSSGQLNEWILESPSSRQHPVEPLSAFVSMNREGFFSVVGYYAIHLLASGMGRVLLTTLSAQRTTSVSWTVSAFSMCLVTWSTTLVLHSYVERVSRRMANAAYVAWVSAYNLQVVVAFVFILLMRFSKSSSSFQIPRLCRAVSDKQLVVFLVGNLLTGVVNMSCDTLAVNPLRAWVIMLAYIGCISVAAIRAMNVV